MASNSSQYEKIAQLHRVPETVCHVTGNYPFDHGIGARPGR